MVVVMPRPRVISDEKLVAYVAARNAAGDDPSTARVARDLGLAYRTAEDRLEGCPFLKHYLCACGRGVLWVAVR